MVERKKVGSIDEVWDGEKLLINDFSNLDLEGIDLSVVPSECWVDCIFHNTSFKNTGIRFFPYYLNVEVQSTMISSFGLELRCRVICDCDFSDNDLSYLNRADFSSFHNFRNCNFSNTKLPFFIYGENNILDESCTKYEYNPYRPKLDLKTIFNNRQLNDSLFWAIFANRGGKRSLTKKEMEQFVLESTKLFELEYGDELKRFYEWLDLDLKQKSLFFCGTIKGVDFNGRNISGFPIEILDCFEFCDCNFNGASLDNSYGDLLKLRGSVFKEDNNYSNFLLPSITYESWRENYDDYKNDRTRKTRISLSPLSFRTNLYLELGRGCNARCKFCRNQFFSDCDYDLKKIISKTKEVLPYLDSVVVGGGEPTLRIKDLRKLGLILPSDLDKYIFTNGTCANLYDKLGSLGYKYNISRHAVSDLENSKIFRLSENDIMNSFELANFIDNVGEKNITLCATCFKGGLDDITKIIEYIDFCKSLGCKHIMLSDLHDDSSLGTNYKANNISISKDLFPNAMSYFVCEGYKRSIPIYATGGYISTVLKHSDGTSIAFKQYISIKELESQWPTAIKRTFDLSMDPNGDLYSNWHQTSGLVKKIGSR